MSRRRTLTLAFEVIEDDMTSEQAADYRETIVNALAQYRVFGRLKGDELRRCDKLLNDCNRNEFGE